MVRILGNMKVLRMFLAATFIFGSLTMLGIDYLHAAPKADARPMADNIQPVNVNKADVEELQTVRGIGPALAERIVQFRKENGPYERLDDLALIRGIGGSKLQKIKGQLTT